MSLLTRSCDCFYVDVIVIIFGNLIISAAQVLVSSWHKSSVAFYFDYANTQLHSSSIRKSSTVYLSFVLSKSSRKNEQVTVFKQFHKHAYVISNFFNADNSINGLYCKTIKYQQLKKNENRIHNYSKKRNKLNPWNIYKIPGQSETCFFYSIGRGLCVLILPLVASYFNFLLSRVFLLGCFSTIGYYGINYYIPVPVVMAVHVQVCC